MFRRRSSPPNNRKDLKKAHESLKSYLEKGKRIEKKEINILKNALTRKNSETVDLFQRILAPGLHKIISMTNNDLKNSLRGKYLMRNNNFPTARINYKGNDLNFLMSHPELVTKLEKKVHEVENFKAANPNATTAHKMAFLLSLSVVEREFESLLNENKWKKRKMIDKNRNAILKIIPNVMEKVPFLVNKSDPSTKLPTNSIRPAIISSKQMNKKTLASTLSPNNKLSPPISLSNVQTNVQTNVPPPIFLSNVHTNVQNNKLTPTPPPFLSHGKKILPINQQQYMKMSPRAPLLPSFRKVRSSKPPLDLIPKAFQEEPKSLSNNRNLLTSDPQIVVGNEPISEANKPIALDRSNLMDAIRAGKTLRPVSPNSLLKAQKLPRHNNKSLPTRNRPMTSLLNEIKNGKRLKKVPKKVQKNNQKTNHKSNFNLAKHLRARRGKINSNNENNENI